MPMIEAISSETLLHRAKKLIAQYPNDTDWSSRRATVWYTW